MFKHLIFGLGLIGLALTACGTSKPVAGVTVEAADTVDLADALLWKVSGKGLRHDSYVFGTIHIIGEEDYFLPAGVETAMEASDKFVFEIDMKEMMDLSTQISLFTKAFMKNGTRLSDLLSAEDYEMVEEHFKDVGLPMVMLDRIKPMFLTVFASSDIEAGDLGMGGDMKSYEMEFFDFAQENEKETGGLETIEFQLSVFDSIPYEAQAEMLVETIEAQDEQNDLFQQMVELYKSQDIEALYMSIGDDEIGAGEYEDILVRNRNERWMQGMGAFMKEGPVFFAVGAGHLGGPNGVIRLLMKEGYTVTPVLTNSTRQARRI
jgi:uncharacterized protein YbaP (TraB family)